MEYVAPVAHACERWNSSTRSRIGERGTGAPKELLGPRESIGYLTLKADTLARLVPLERKAFNLDLSVDVRELSNEQVIWLLERAQGG